MTPKAGKRKRRDELIAVKVMREQEWAYERWLEHMSYQAMRVAASRPPEAGGLGYDLSAATFEGLVKGYREREGLSELTRDEARERRAHDLALIMRATRAAMAKAAALGALDVHAAKLNLEAGRDLAKHYGTDQPITVEANVTHRDAVTEELNAMLAAAGRNPVEVDHD
jgi:hypothetical protein